MKAKLVTDHWVNGHNFRTENTTTKKSVMLRFLKQSIDHSSQCKNPNAYLRETDLFKELWASLLKGNTIGIDAKEYTYKMYNIGA